MAHSMSLAVAQPAGGFTHALSATRFDISSDPDGMAITMTRNGESAKYPMAYTIGSGKHAYGYLMRVRNYLFQAPISFYTARRMWDMAPGYESDPKPDFFRPITPECLQCHAGKTRPLPGTLNQYQSIEPADQAISCDRCHGDLSAHLQHPSRDTIVNPQRLAIRERDSVCEQCHLSGEVRVLNPGRQFSDFRPGQKLEEVFSVYVRDVSRQASGGSIKVVSHVEQLALSTCARKSDGKLWCGTCHDPHQEPTNPVAYFRARCLSCHGETLLRTHAKPVDDCISCHMPKRNARDGAHTVFTDHEISRNPSAQQNSSPTDPVVQLRAWHEPSGLLAARNHGIADVMIGDREHSSDLLDQGASELVSVMKNLPPDPVLLAKIGLVLLRKNMSSDAIEVFEYTVKLEPNSAGSHANLGSAYDQAGQTAKAVDELKQATVLDPGLESAYLALSEIYLRENQLPDLRRVIEWYLKALPNNVAAKNALEKLDSRLPSN